MAQIRISGMCAPRPWAWRYDLGSRSWHTLESWTIIVRNIIQIQHVSEELWPGHGFWVCLHCDLAFGIWPLVKVMTHPWAMDNNNYCVKYYSDLTWQWQVMARTGILCMCALWTWPWRYDLGSSSWHTLGSWTAIVWNIIYIQHSSEELCPDTYFLVYVDLAGMNSGQSHDTPLLLGQQWCDILSRSNMAVTSYGPDTEIGYVCTVNLTLEIWFLVKVMTYDLGSWHMTVGQGHDTSLGNGQ